MKVVMVIIGSEEAKGQEVEQKKRMVMKKFSF